MSKNSLILLPLFFLLSFQVFSCPLTTEEIKSGAQCIDVGGYELYLHSSGKEKPIIILEAGLGDSSFVWDKVTPQVEKFAHVIVYDRAGLGKSNSKAGETEPRTAQQAVNNLRALLKKAEINPPYILVGHSLGGLYMQLFAQEYPDEVSAVVLVDSATKEQKIPPLPPPDANYYLEAKGFKESIQQVIKAPSFPHIPLVVLSTSQRGSEWLKLQKNLLKLSPNMSTQVITHESGHFIQREEPDLVIKALDKIVKKLKADDKENQ